MLILGPYNIVGTNLRLFVLVLKKGVINKLYNKRSLSLVAFPLTDSSENMMAKCKILFWRVHDLVIKGLQNGIVVNCWIKRVAANYLM